jgi:hypothetical protein
MEQHWIPLTPFPLLLQVLDEALELSKESGCDLVAGAVSFRISTN